ncbi:fumarylacetoacetase [bacterium CG_4_9_14_3_um_filter_65_15]|nr:MAG: fumarylacetoacetase [bacterium CG_4_9_14_3_um_filter_65_15]
MEAVLDSDARSFVPVPEASHFPLYNLPYGIFSPSAGESPRVGVRIGDHVLDLSIIADMGLLEAAGLPHGIFSQPWLNAFMEQPADNRRLVRILIHGLLRETEPTLRDDESLRRRALLPADSVTMHMPVMIRDYTDFYSSREHATNVGIMFRGKEKALMPNWLHMPVGYHGRASSVVVSETDIVRPCGQTVAADGTVPGFGPSRLLDFELEMGFLVAGGNALGDPVSVDDAWDRIFGLVVVNDWSARDIQKWEYQPLGPFNAKNFATSISPWVVTIDALAPFACAAPEQDPEPLPYLREKQRRTFDIDLQVDLTASGQEEALTICRSNFKHLYWTMAQQLAHHTCTGCNLGTGDLLASGTISGPDKGSYGSLLEITWRGTEAIALPSGGKRKFLADGDRVTMSALCEKDGLRLGFGEVTGRVLPARTEAT